MLDGAFAFYLWRNFESFPELIALHFNPFGEADLIGSKTDIYKLPLIAAAIWASNLVIAVVSSPYDRVLSRTTLAVTLFVELLLILGAWRILF